MRILQERLGITQLGFLLKVSVQVTTDPNLNRAIDDGFPNDDAFDATAGLFGMLEVLMSRPTDQEPDDDKVRKLERWICSQKCNS